jgi:hypothetical protein
LFDELLLGDVIDDVDDDDDDESVVWTPSLASFLSYFWIKLAILIIVGDP